MQIVNVTSFFENSVSRKRNEKAIAKQMRFIFFIPLVVGILHTLFALKGLATVIPYEIAVPLLISIRGV